MLSSSSSSSSSMNFSCFALFTLICILTEFTYEATVLPSDEVEALKDIGKTLGKVWNFSVDPCSGQHGWSSSLADAVTCNCSYLSSTVCHVVNIVLKFQSLPGTLPTELVRLPYLQELDVTGNYLNGTIPREWGSMAHLGKLSVKENRLTGPIPKEIGNISTLQSFDVESNDLSGDLPSELGNLTRLQKLFLNTNRFTGELPASFAKLTNLIDLWLSDNQFNGTIPAFIQNFTNLNRLVIQGSGLQGPIPLGIVALKDLVELRISDLGGEEAEFPQIGNKINMTILILRNCNLIGEVPDILGMMTNLRTLDISFNKLTGQLSSTFDSLTSVNYILCLNYTEAVAKNLSNILAWYLTSNQFTGPMRDSFLTAENFIDLSYNKLTIESSKCPLSSNVNIFKSSPESNNSGELSCLGGLQCRARSGSLFINCGGPAVNISGIQYVADNDPGSPSKFFNDEYNNWAYSSTGHFIDSSNGITYISSNMIELSTKRPQLYTHARLAPISLAYYAYCLVNGTYTVSLHFVEIMFTNGIDYRSLGRRIFDVYIQGKLVLQDFNIVDEAKGAGKLIIKEFKDIPVTNGTLEIRFYWAGKGTRFIPDGGVYGPLISAITIDSGSDESQISAGAIAGIVAAVTIVVILISMFWYWRCFKRGPKLEQDLEGVNLDSGTFTLRRIKAATNNFDDANKIGEGGFGPVYKGVLSDGRAIAVKQLSSKSRQGNREFVNEIGVIYALQHPNLVKLYGCCIDGNQLLLIYEYMENNSLSRVLFGSNEYQLKLDWRTRNMICMGIARGLAYLHGGSRLKIVHRDIKASNVLLDGSLNPKISDFGLAKLDAEDNTPIRTRIAGTYGYMAPEYAMQGILTEKADVYSFGILTLEIVSGRSNRAGILLRDDFFDLLDWARALKASGDLMQLIDPGLGSDYNEEEVLVMIDIALLCTCASPADRPNMSSVVSMLEGKTVDPRFAIDSREFAISVDEMEAITKHFRGIETYVDVVDESRQCSHTSAKIVGSTQNESDHYPLKSDAFSGSNSD